MTYGSMSSYLSQILPVQGQDSNLVGLILDAFFSSVLGGSPQLGHYHFISLFKNSLSRGCSLQNETLPRLDVVNLIVIFVTFLDCALLV